MYNFKKYFFFKMPVIWDTLPGNLSPPGSWRTKIGKPTRRSWHSESACSKISKISVHNINNRASYSQNLIKNKIGGSADLTLE